MAVRAVAANCTTLILTFLNYLLIGKEIDIEIGTLKLSVFIDIGDKQTNGENFCIKIITLYSL